MILGVKQYPSLPFSLLNKLVEQSGQTSETSLTFGQPFLNWTAMHISIPDKREMQFWFSRSMPLKFQFIYLNSSFLGIHTHSQRNELAGMYILNFILLHTSPSLLFQQVGI